MFVYPKHYYISSMNFALVWDEDVIVLCRRYLLIPFPPFSNRWINL